MTRRDADGHGAGDGTVTIRGKAGIVGIGLAEIHRWGGSPRDEFVLALEAVLAACSDAGIDPTAIDGFSSFANDRNTSVRLAAALGVDELRYSNMQWVSGGGGMAGAVASAASAVATGEASCVVVLRGIAQGQYGRIGQGGTASAVSGEFAFTAPYGVMSAAQMFAMRYRRWMYEHGGVGLDAQRAVALACYRHAQGNPNAVMHGRPLSEEGYDSARRIVEPWCLYDCCQESDGAAAMVLVPAERARALVERPVYLLGAVQGAAHRFPATVHNSPEYASAGFSTVGPRLWEASGVRPADVDVVESYDNFTGGVVMSLVEHGMCAAEEVDEVLTLDDLSAPSGRMPLNTAGGNLAEGYLHGLGLALEGVRQIRGDSCNQVPGARIALIAGAPMTASTGSLVLGSEEAL